MDQSQNTVPIQSLAADSPDTGETPANRPAGDEQAHPITIDAPALAPLDAHAEADTTQPPKAGTLTRWIAPKAQGAGVFASTDRVTPDTAPRWQLPRAARFAAAFALAIGGGAAIGAAGSFWLSGKASPDASIAFNERDQLRASIEHLNSELTTLRGTVEGTGRTANTQVVRLTERVDRVERAQAEPAAKIAKLGEAVERIDRRTHDLPDLGPIPEGRIAPPTPIKEISRLSVVPGWVLQSVFDGAALIQGRIGVIEVEVGDPLPGGGRVEAIRRQEGRWVVVTSKGLIVAAR
jgi:ketosteroid isomerase-like protein